ncbi:MAG: geranylgeranylglycerol-phosphate geranylgeranyltransferase [Bacteroidales bacterium]|nr:geranylgeranylglycerol-phosphate geranylgeranyltransferase [Bacteroidales bacterium]
MVKSFFKLIRWPNLIIILMSMSFLLWLVIRPGLGPVVKNNGLTLPEFILLAISIVFTAIGGYIINDIKDISADKINKPGKNSIGIVFTVNQAYALYAFFAVTGVASGTAVSIMLHKIDFSLIFLLTAGLLWFYATAYKCQPVTGNLVVAFLSALSFGLVFLYELFALQMEDIHMKIDPVALQIVYSVVLIYMIFAFLVSLLREVIKDIEDEEGDEKTGCGTFAVVYGNHKAKILALVVGIIGLLASFGFQWLFFQKEFFILFFYFILIDILFALVIIKIIQAKEKLHFTKLSVFVKLLMLAGILSMVLFYFEFVR